MERLTDKARWNMAIGVAVNMLRTPLMHAKRVELANQLYFYAPSRELREAALAEARTIIESEGEGV